MQLIAMLTMLIDHAGIVFFPDQIWLRVIGRIAFPIYAYALVQGHYFTRSRTKYLFRLFILALLSQIPYQLALDPDGLNVVVTLFVAAAVLQILERNLSMAAKAGIVLALCVLMEGFPFDYGAYGLLLVIAFRYASSEKLLGAHLLLNIMYLIAFGAGAILQMLSIVPTLVIVYGPYLWKKIEQARVRAWVWRSFYPLHLTVLAVLQRLDA